MTRLNLLHQTQAEAKAQVALAEYQAKQVTEYVLQLMQVTETWFSNSCSTFSNLVPSRKRYLAEDTETEVLYEC